MEALHALRRCSAVRQPCRASAAVSAPVTVARSPGLLRAAFVVAAVLVRLTGDPHTHAARRRLDHGLALLTDAVVIRVMMRRVVLRDAVDVVLVVVAASIWRFAGAGRLARLASRRWFRRVRRLGGASRARRRGFSRDGCLSRRDGARLCCLRGRRPRRFRRDRGRCIGSRRLRRVRQTFTASCEANAPTAASVMSVSPMPVAMIFCRMLSPAPVMLDVAGPAPPLAWDNRAAMRKVTPHGARS